MSPPSESARAFRLQQAVREAPAALAAAGVVIAILFALDTIERRFALGVVDVLHVAGLAVFLGAWLLVRSGRLRPAAVPWVLSVVAAVLTITLLVIALAVDKSVVLAYVVLAMLAYGAFILGWLALMTAEVVSYGAFILVVPRITTVDLGQWALVGLTAVLAALAILRLRLHALDALAVASERTHELATRDLLTSTLNRNGLDERLPGLVAGAVRREEYVFAVFVDIDGLKAANDARDHAFGDRVISRVADVLHAAARPSDLVARWGGDEFLVIGAGEPQSQETWQDRLNEALGRSDDLDGWTRQVSVGVANVPATDLDLDLLTREADQQMYALRRLRRFGAAEPAEPSAG